MAKKKAAKKATPKARPRKGTAANRRAAKKPATRKPAARKKTATTAPAGPARRGVSLTDAQKARQLIRRGRPRTSEKARQILQRAGLLGGGGRFRAGRRATRPLIRRAVGRRGAVRMRADQIRSAGITSLMARGQTSQLIDYIRGKRRPSRDKRQVERAVKSATEG